MKIITPPPKGQKGPKLSTRRLVQRPPPICQRDGTSSSLQGPAASLPNSGFIRRELLPAAQRIRRLSFQLCLNLGILMPAWRGRVGSPDLHELVFSGGKPSGRLPATTIAGSLPLDFPCWFWLVTKRAYRDTWIWHATPRPSPPEARREPDLTRPPGMLPRSDVETPQMVSHVV